MARALALGIGFGVGMAWWQSRPPMEGMSGRAMFVLTAVMVAVAFFAGRARRGAPVALASARAEANAEATAVQQVNVNLGEGARAAAAADLGGLDRVSWIGERIDQDLDHVSDGDLAGMLEDTDDNLEELGRGLAPGRAAARRQDPPSAPEALTYGDHVLNRATPDGQTSGAGTDPVQGDR